MSAESIKAQLADLEQALEQRLPGMKTMLADIYKQMKNEPDVVTVMSEEEIAVVVRGLKVYANAEIPVSKSASKTKKPKYSPEDL